MKKTFVKVVLVIMVVLGTSTLSYSGTLIKKGLPPNFVIENVIIYDYGELLPDRTTPNDYLVYFNVKNLGGPAFGYQFMVATVTVTYDLTYEGHAECVDSVIRENRVFLKPSEEILSKLFMVRFKSVPDGVEDEQMNDRCKDVTIELESIFPTRKVWDNWECDGGCCIGEGIGTCRQYTNY